MQSTTGERNNEERTQYQHQHRNDDWPSHNIELDPRQFPPPIITSCNEYDTYIYHPSGEKYIDNEGACHFRIIEPLVQRNGTMGNKCSRNSSSREDNGALHGLHDDTPRKYAYWIMNSKRDKMGQGAIYGRVYQGRLLKFEEAPDGSFKWIITADNVAIKSMSHHRINRGRKEGGLTEDPYQEIAAVQYLQFRLNKKDEIIRDNDAGVDKNMNIDELKTRAEYIMRNYNVITSIDALSSESHLFHVIPFCECGDLFNFVGNGDKFSEPEARFFFKQILNAIETLQMAEMCHRDMSLENLVVTRRGEILAITIDFGLCLMIPYKFCKDIGTRERCLMKVKRGQWGKVRNLR